MTTIHPPRTAPTFSTLRTVRFTFLSLVLAVCGAIAGQNVAEQDKEPAQKVPDARWQLVWSDEFSGVDGTLPDSRHWTFDLGGHNANQELETYTAEAKNVQQRDGKLVITAVKEDRTGADGIPRHYTSARIKSEGLFAQAYGRFEARIQLPLGKGIWPAFWMLGDDIGTAGWPRCGEIDILENIGEPRISYSTLHGPGYSGGQALSTKYGLPAGATVDDGFHVYAIEWTPGEIEFLLDGELVAKRTKADLPSDTKWVYDHPFFIILNVAVGGAWPGNPDATTVFPQQMLVDYVRVYKAVPSAVPANGPSHD